MPSSTPGLWFNFTSVPILSSPFAQNLAVVPAGATMYVDYLAFGCYNALPDGLLLYVAADGIPVLYLAPGRLAAQQLFDPTLVVTGLLTFGAVGTLDTPKSVLVSYRAQVL